MVDHAPPVIEEPRGSFFSNLIAIVGLIILVVVVIWGLVHLVGLSQGWFSSLFGGGGPKVTVSAPKEVTAGTPFMISWKYPTNEKGNYAFLYQCKTGLSLKNSTIQIPCGNAYTVGAVNSITVTPTLQGFSTSTLPITVVFIPAATSSERVQGTASVLVFASTSAPAPIVVQPAPTPTPTPKPTPTPSPTPVAPTVVSTPANLVVRILALGVIDRNTGMFVNRAPMYPDDIAAAQLDISNVGGATSGTYYFSANLPTMGLPGQGGYVYNSPAQAPLGSGDHVINTLRWTFSAPVGTFTVAVSGDGDTADNFASATIGNAYAPQPAYYYPGYTNSF